MDTSVLLEVAKQAPALIVALAALFVLGSKLDRLADRVDRLSETLLGHDPDSDKPKTRRKPPRASVGAQDEARV